MSKFYEVYSNNEFLSAVLREMSLAKNMLILSNCDSSEGLELLLKPFRHKVYRPGEPEVPIGSRMFKPEIADGKKLSAVLRETAGQAHKINKVCNEILSALLRETALKKGCLFFQKPDLQQVA